MTRARSLKQTIRARAKKTGERYTTARRHVMAQLATPGKPPRRSAGPAEPPPAAAAPAHPPPPSKGGVSDAKVREKTGHGLDHWFERLDRFGGVEKGHSALARHLYDGHAVPGWYAQGITVAYERARGARVLNQRTSGDYEVSITKTLNGDTRAVVRAFTDTRRRERWLEAADAELGGALTAALKSTSSKGFVIRTDGLGRYRYKWRTTTVQIYAIPKGGGRTSVVVTHLRLLDAGAVERSRADWRVALAALASLFAD
jgi:hypothetical protein